jgi:hypothetical protein
VVSHTTNNKRKHEVIEFSTAQRVSPFAVLAVLIALITACAGDDKATEVVGVEVGNSEKSTMPMTIPENRFAEINYPNAETHQWSGPEEIYKETCNYCHSSGVGPELLGRSLPPVYIAHTVRNGSNGMPSFRQTDFSNEELQALGEMIQGSKAPAPVGAP